MTTLKTLNPNKTTDAIDVKTVISLSNQLAQEKLKQMQDPDKVNFIKSLIHDQFSI